MCIIQEFGPYVRRKELTADVLQVSLAWNSLNILPEPIQVFHEIEIVDDVSISQCLESLQTTAILCPVWLRTGMEEIALSGKASKNFMKMQTFM